MAKARSLLALTSAPAFLAAFLAAEGARADIGNPSDHPPYTVELEPHLLLDEIFDDDNFGVGVRGTFILMDPGFVSSINNTAGIGVGLDYINFDDHCFRRGRDDEYCVDGGTLWNIPVVAHWRFWFTRSWSAFAELGLVFQFYNRDRDDDRYDDDDRDIDLGLFLGGSYNFSDSIGLTLRIGSHSDLSLGLSIFF